ncbi:hypothetical protein BC830DRAFT_1135179 [Chytriomyces sp. MP71]|nr:hypothetical protein BC830DRAFT_1135179 [Chytriomyces sp. MP71]
MSKMHREIPNHVSFVLLAVIPQQSFFSHPTSQRLQLHVTCHCPHSPTLPPESHP